MRIRIAREEDLPAINKIYNQAVNQKFCTAHLRPLSSEEQFRWFKGHNPDRYPVFVSTEDERVTGWISLGAYRADRQALEHVAEVSYYVEKNARGRGLGTRLLEHVLEQAPGFGFSVLIAILLSRNPASVALLKKMGFACWGTMPGIARIEEQQVDHLYYGLNL